MNPLAALTRPDIRTHSCPSKPRPGSNNIAVGAAPVREIATKFLIGKLPGCEAFTLHVTGHIRSHGFEQLAIGVTDVKRVGRLPVHIATR